MTACTERHTAARAITLAGEGQKGMPKVAQPDLRGFARPGDAAKVPI